jgi:hypothetical protein
MCCNILAVGRNCSTLQVASLWLVHTSVGVRRRPGEGDVGDVVERR